MRTSLRNLEIIEEAILNNSKEDQLLLEAKSILMPNLQEDVLLQLMTYESVKTYGRKQLKREIAEVEHQLFTQSQFSQFRNKILSYFKS